MIARTAVGLVCIVIGVQACESSSTSPSNDPHGIPTTPSIASVATGARSCAVTTAGAVYCWGATSTLATAIVSPAVVATPGGATFSTLSISRVADLVCGLTTTGAAFCWGDNEAGQLGDGTTIRRESPTAVSGGLSFKSIAVGNANVCAIALDGSAYCWGTGPTGGLGDGTNGTHLTPAPAAAGLTFQSIVTGSGFSCALATMRRRTVGGSVSVVSSATMRRRPARPRFALREI